MAPLVIDIYHGDNVYDAARVKAYGIVGVIHKASEGTAYADPLYTKRRKLFTDIGLAWGAYHFFHGTGKAEADHFLATAQPDKSTLIALDWETTQAGYTPTAAQAREFLDRIQEKLGRKAKIYSGHAAKERIQGHDPYFSAHDLWLAMFSNHWNCQQSWTHPWLWQNNGDNNGPGPHHIPGVAGFCDNNTIVSGTVDELLATWARGGGVPTPAPTPGPEMASGKGSWYSQYDGKYRWVDTGDTPGSAALGVPDNEQGIALYNELTLGKWFRVKAPNGVVSFEQQTDIGPHPRTGRKIDISAAAAERLGYSPNDFPTDSIFQWEPIDPPTAVAGLSLREQAKVYYELRSQTAQGE